MIDEVAAFPACLPIPLMLEPEHQIACKQPMKLEQAMQLYHVHHSIATTSVLWAIPIA
jgi:hypothetical protein